MRMCAPLNASLPSRDRLRSTLSASATKLGAKSMRRAMAAVDGSASVFKLNSVQGKSRSSAGGSTLRLGSMAASTRLRSKSFAAKLWVSSDKSRARTYTSSTCEIARSGSNCWTGSGLPLLLMHAPITWIETNGTIECRICRGVNVQNASIMHYSSLG